MDFVFVVAMGLELGLKVLAEGMLFTPKALIRDLSGMLDIFIFVVSLIWVCWMPQVSELGKKSFRQLFVQQQ